MEDKLFVEVPSALVVALKAAVYATESEEDLKAAMAAYGGEPRCFERFLLARNLKVPAATLMMRQAIAFRRDVVSRVVPISISLYEKVIPLWPGWICGRCNVTSARPQGMTVQYFRFGDVAPRRLMEIVTEEEFRTFYTHWMETSLRHELETNTPGGPSREWKGMVEIHDLQGLHISQLYMPGIRMLARAQSAFL